MTERGYRPEIDGLRAIAVISVVLYHAGMGAAHAGFVGVDIFFVISGYLITALLYREWQVVGRIDLAAFYVRRVRRILPALWLVVAVTLMAASVLLSPVSGQPQGVAKSAVAALGFFANVYFQNTTGGYFDVSSSELPLLHLWSLSVEEQFYFLWPLLLIGLLRWFRASAGVIVVALCAASLLLCEHWIVTAPTSAFYEMPARWWELGVGALVALQAPMPLQRRAVEALAAIGLAIVLVSVFVAWPAGHFPGAGALGATFGTGLLLFTIHHASALGPVGIALRSRPAVFFGLISYSLYLWHWPLLAIDRAMRLEPTPPANRAALVAAAVLLAWLSYRFVETPFRRKRPSLPRSRVLVAGAAASLLLCACAGVIGWMARGAGHNNSIAAAAVVDKPTNIAACHFRGDVPIRALKPASCNSLPSVAPSVAIWGDSHALAWQPYAYGWAAAAKQSAASWTLDACPPALGYLGLTERADPMYVCRNFNQLVIDHVKSSHVETLILAGRWLRYLYDIPDNFVESNDVADPAWRALARSSLERGLKATLNEVAPKVGRVILLGPVPQLRQDAVRCLESGQTKRCSLSREEFDARAKPAIAFLSTLAAEHDNVTLVDPSDFFCTHIECPVARDGYSLYWDNNHVSSTAARNFLRSYLDSHPAPIAR